MRAFTVNPIGVVRGFKTHKSMSPCASQNGYHDWGDTDDLVAKLPEDAVLRYNAYIEDQTIPLAKDISEHLVRCTRAFYKRALGDYNPSPLLGETERATVTADDAKNILREISGSYGWHVDDLDFAPHKAADGQYLGEQLVHSKEGNDVALVHVDLTEASPRPPIYLSNVRAEEATKHRRYAALDQAPGVRVLRTRGNSKILRLERGSSFRVIRPRAEEGWSEVTLLWNGKSLKKYSSGRNLKKAKAAA